MTAFRAFSSLLRLLAVKAENAAAQVAFLADGRGDLARLGGVLSTKRRVSRAVRGSWLEAFLGSQAAGPLVMAICFAAVELWLCSRIAKMTSHVDVLGARVEAVIVVFCALALVGVAIRDARAHRAKRWAQSFRWMLANVALKQGMEWAQDNWPVLANEERAIREALRLRRSLKGADRIADQKATGRGDGRGPPRATRRASRL